ncbi:hypothetical protein B0A48_00755 [Cryoendolithus antarcticus]|uniref:Uncharacterized protein n=1 Tax=Cryoendolithus antarcticus TaxID=1507870 RepID=A0A1V8TR74_9PEZI|nr:hypothetical protein B0A48_00755 [Cryoendolithus antarcticus]
MVALSYIITVSAAEGEATLTAHRTVAAALDLGGLRIAHSSLARESDLSEADLITWREDGRTRYISGTDAVKPWLPALAPYLTGGRARIYGTAVEFPGSMTMALQNVNEVAHVVGLRPCKCIMPRVQSLLTLPPELRNKIYAMALVHKYALEIREAGDSASATNDLHVARYRPGEDCRAMHPRLLALTQTCRQLQSDTQKMFYEVNLFDICLGMSTLTRWTESTSRRWLLGLPLGIAQNFRSLVVRLSPRAVLEWIGRDPGHFRLDTIAFVAMHFALGGVKNFPTSNKQGTFDVFRQVRQSLEETMEASDDPTRKRHLQMDLLLALGASLSDTAGWLETTENGRSTFLAACYIKRRTDLQSDSTPRSRLSTMSDSFCYWLACFLVISVSVVIVILLVANLVRLVDPEFRLPGDASVGSRGNRVLSPRFE